MIFDGAGNYTFTGQQVTGTAAAAAATGGGTYSVDPAGFVTMTSPIRTGDKVNARLSSEALIGSGTENTDNTFDLLVAIPVPTTPVALTGPYTVVTLEFPNGSTAGAINTIFTLNSAGIGQLSPISVFGHTPSVVSGSPTTQMVTGATYSVPSSGTGTLTFGSSSALLSGSKNVYISASGNVIIGGSVAAGAHDFLIGVKATPNPTVSSWNGNSWTAGLRYESQASQPPWISNAGSLAARGAGSITFYTAAERLRLRCFRFHRSRSLHGEPHRTADRGTGPSRIGRERHIRRIGNRPERSRGLRDLFRRPDDFAQWQRRIPESVGVLSAASFAPAGNPISPGEFVALFGTGLVASNLTAKAPYPTTLNNVTVTVNGTKAPIYSVTHLPQYDQINCLIPYGTTGATATIVVTNGSAPSNTVTVPVAATVTGHLFARPIGLRLRSHRARQWERSERRQSGKPGRNRSGLPDRHGRGNAGGRRWNRKHRQSAEQDRTAHGLRRRSTSQRDVQRPRPRIPGPLPTQCHNPA